MTESVVAPATARPEEIRLPPSPPRLPKIVQGVGYAFFRRQFGRRRRAHDQECLHPRLGG